MIRITLTLTYLFFFYFGALAQTREAHTPNGTIKFKVVPNALLINLEDDTSLLQNNSRNLLEKFGAISYERSHLKNQYFSLLEFEKSSKAQINKNIETFNSDAAIKYVGRVLQYNDGTYQGITNKISIKLKPTTEEVIFRSFLKGFLIDSVSAIKFIPGGYTVYLNSENSHDAFDTANQFYSSGLFEFAEVNYIRIAKKHSSDPYFDNQWNIKNTGSALQYQGIAGADMGVVESWNYSRGKGIKIAVLDEGIDLEHPDLKVNLLPGYDATGRGSKGASSGNDAHGTACAGIIAAVRNDIGIVGVAYESKIIPVRIGRSNFNGDAWTSDDVSAEGIFWAAKSDGGNADILSCSWGGGSESSVVTYAVNFAMTSGRGGKGSVVLFSTGNFNSDISFPATIPGVIAVGASTMCDSRKSSSKNTALLGKGVSPDSRGVSCDKENYWGSNFGNEISIVAPGVKISTTDISGPNGYHNEVGGIELINQSYIKNFNGTSAACPNAAGVVALILSVNPSLLQSQAKFILESTTDKPASYTYIDSPGHKSGSWNREVGYGRVNALKAVQKAKNYSASSKASTFTEVKN